MTDARAEDELVSQDTPSETNLTETEIDLPPDYQTLSYGHDVVQPRSIIVSGALIFPSEPPADALYQLSRDLVAGTRISVSRIDHEVHTTSNNTPNIRIRDRILYTFSHLIFDDSSIEILGKRREAFRSLLMERTSGLREERWTVFCDATADQDKGSILFQSRCPHKWLHYSATSYQWHDSINRLIAVEEEKTSTNQSSGSPSTACCLRLIRPLSQQVADALITAWCARIWNRNLRATGQVKNVSKGKNAHFKQSTKEK